MANEDVGCHELVRDGVNGFLFKSQDVQGLAGKITQALNYPHLGHRARETILRDFDLRKNVLRYIDLYEEVLHR